MSGDVDSDPNSAGPSSDGRVFPETASERKDEGMSDRDQTAYTADLGDDLDSDLSAEDLAEDEWTEAMDTEGDHYATGDLAGGDGGQPDQVYDDEAAAESAPYPERRESFAPPMALGMLFFLATIAAAVGMGYGVMMALGGHPSQLLDFKGLLNFERFFAFGENPANLFWLLAFAVTVLGLLVSGAVARVVKKVRQQAEWRQALLDRLTRQAHQGQFLRSGQTYTL